MDIYLPTWLGSYAGDSETFEKYEYLTVSKISPASRVAPVRQFEDAVV